MRYSWRWLLAWGVLIVAAFGFELWSILDFNPTTPPLTDVIGRFVPGWLTFAGIGWLIWHFGNRYREP